MACLNADIFSIFLSAIGEDILSTWFCNKTCRRKKKKKKFKVLQAADRHACRQLEEKWNKHICPHRVCRQEAAGLRGDFFSVVEQVRHDPCSQQNSKRKLRKLF